MLDLLFMKLISFHNDDPMVPVLGKLMDLGKECNSKYTLISKPRFSDDPWWHTPFVLTPCSPCVATARCPPRAQISGFHPADSVQRIVPERTMLPYVGRCRAAFRRPLSSHPYTTLSSSSLLYYSTTTSSFAILQPQLLRTGPCIVGQHM